VERKDVLALIPRRKKGKDEKWKTGMVKSERIEEKDKPNYRDTT